MRAGYQALVRRFAFRFPEPEFRYVVSIAEKENSVPRIFTGKDVFKDIESEKVSGDRNWIVIYHRKSDTELAHITCNLTFGIQLRVISPYLRENFYLYRRPKNLNKGTQFHRRDWLQEKPKFGKIGSSLSSQIHFLFAEACLSCRSKKRQFDSLCLDCHLNACAGSANVSL